MSFRPGELWIWEGFVSKQYKPTPEPGLDPRIADARFMVEHGFVPLVMPSGAFAEANWPIDGRATLSLVGDALLSSGVIDLDHVAPERWWTGSSMVIAPSTSGPNLLHPRRPGVEEPSDR